MVKSETPTGCEPAGASDPQPDDTRKEADMHATRCPVPTWQALALVRGFRQLDALHWRTPAGSVVSAEFVRRHCGG